MVTGNRAPASALRAIRSETRRPASSHSIVASSSRPAASHARRPA